MRGKLRGTRGALVLATLLGWSGRPAGAPPGCAFVADTLVRVGSGSRIDGDLGANRRDGTVQVGRRVELADGTTVAGDTVELRNGTSVFDVAAEALERSRGVIVRGAVSVPSLPLATPFCETPPVACSGHDVRVGNQAESPLTPGTYGRVVVENGGMLTLAAGAYTLCGLRSGRNGTIAIGSGGPTTIAVGGDLLLESGTTVLPDAGSPLPQIVVAGSRLKIAAGARIEASIMASAAQAMIGRGATVVGAICSDTLATGRNVALGCAETPSAPSTTSTSTAPTTTCPPASSSTTTTVVTTSTTTIPLPLDCGNGIPNTGETCDDGNNSDNDACPSDCQIDACTPLTTTQRFVSVRFAPPEGGLVAGLTLLLDYPEGSVDLPGNGTSFPSGTISGVPAGAFVSANDLNFNSKGHAVRITVGAGAALAPGQFVRLRFNDCQGATVPPPSAFPCTVLNASDPFLNAVNGVTCFVVIE